MPSLNALSMLGLGSSGRVPRGDEWMVAPIPTRRQDALWLPHRPHAQATALIAGGLFQLHPPRRLSGVVGEFRGQWATPIQLFGRLVAEDLRPWCCFWRLGPIRSMIDLHQF